LSSIGRSLQRLRGAAADAEGWIRFDEALLELAALLAAWRTAAAPTTVDAALARLADAVAAPALGALLAGSVTAIRMREVIRVAEIDGAPPDVLDALRLVGRALVERTEIQSLTLAPPTASALERLAQRRGCDPRALLDEFTTAVETGDLDYRNRVLPRLAALPLDHPESYSGDPRIDEAARGLLERVHSIHPFYTHKKWLRFVEALVALLKYVQKVRDVMPSFVRCEAAEGLGQHASEADLQQDVFLHLRDAFGYSAIYEMMRVGGGRSDAGVVFDDCRFPIEIKHEFSDVSRTHVHEAYVAQTDVYAASSDRIGFLAILDLRAENAASHARARRGLSASSLYGLTEGAWVDSLPADPNVADARASAVVVLLVPGNRPMPSGMTTYARRPPGAERRGGGA
jgi:hypothetical protein